MKDTNDLIILYDYYGELLTPSQKIYFEDYYFNNLSLSEISENLGVSRNAVHKQIKISQEKLKNYEEILKLYSNTCKIKEILNKTNNQKLKDDILNILEGE